MSGAPRVIAIVAMDDARVIGVKGGLPWHLPEDMKRFSALTRGHTVLMGRKTFDSLPAKFKPLPQRRNLVISRQSISIPGVEISKDPVQCIKSFRAGSGQSGDILWVIGGAEIYRATVSEWDEVAVTRVAGIHEGDAFFPEFEDKFELVESIPGNGCVYEMYKRAV